MKQSNNVFYHISKKYLDKKVTLTPKVPESALINKEGNIPRICVSDDPLLCVRSVMSNPKIQVRNFIEFKKN